VLGKWTLTNLASNSGGVIQRYSSALACYANNLKFLMPQLRAFNWADKLEDRLDKRLNTTRLPWKKQKGTDPCQRSIVVVNVEDKAYPCF
jgi:hypothetical protein